MCASDSRDFGLGIELLDQLQVLFVCPGLPSILGDRTRRTLDFISPYDYGETVRFSSREQTFRNLLTMQNTARAVVCVLRRLRLGSLRLDHHHPAYRLTHRLHEFSER